MRRQIRLRLLWGMCIILAFTSCAPEEDVSAETGGDYDDLVQLFRDFRELQKPVITDWVPDYTPAAMEKQRRGLLDSQRRLKAIDISNWPVEQKVEYHLVRAEMNGLDFYQRVLKPWSRDPGFYLQTQDGAGPARFGHVNINQMPIPDEDLDQVQGQLKALPDILEQAKKNLTDGAADLAYCALHYMDTEIEYHRMLRDDIADNHPDLLQDAESALAAVIEYGEWLKDNESSMTAPAGVGKENYNWWMKNVQLVPYTWDQLYDIIMREDDRLLTTVALERNRNKRLPELEPVPSQEEHSRRRDQALKFAMEFMEGQDLFGIPEGVDVDEYLGRRPNKEMQWGYYFTNKYVGSAETGEWPGVRDFFHRTADREPLPEQTHEFIGHHFDAKRHALDTSPIRGSDRFYAIDMIRLEGWGFWLEEMMMHAGYLDTRPTRAREIVYWQAAFRTCRAIADLKMHSNEFSLDDAIEYCAECAPNDWLIPNGPHAWYEMQTNLRYVGWHMGMVIGKISINQLIAERVRQVGDDFSYRDFFEEFFSAGIIPLSLIRWQMTDLDDEMEILLK
jgi:hypothetical protein